MTTSARSIFTVGRLLVLVLAGLVGLSACETSSVYENRYARYYDACDQRAGFCYANCSTYADEGLRRECQQSCTAQVDQCFIGVGERIEADNAIRYTPIPYYGSYGYYRPGYGYSYGRYSYGGRDYGYDRPGYGYVHPGYGYDPYRGYGYRGYDRRRDYDYDRRRGDGRRDYDRPDYDRDDDRDGGSERGRVTKPGTDNPNNPRDRNRGTDNDLETPRPPHARPRMQADPPGPEPRRLRKPGARDND